MANFDPAFDKMIRNEGGPLESTRKDLAARRICVERTADEELT